MIRILIVDDQEQFLALLTPMLACHGYETHAARSAQEALEALARQPFDAVLADIWMNPVGGMELLASVRDAYPDLPVVMMTGYGTVETALEALKLGAFDYLTKPFDVNDLYDVVERSIAWARARSGSNAPQDLPVYVAPDLVCNSEAMRTVWKNVEHFAITHAPVLFEGELGAGKRRLARALHALSGRGPDAFTELMGAEFSRDVDVDEAVEDRANLLSELRGCTICFTDVERLPWAVQKELLTLLRVNKSDDGAAAPPVADRVRVLATTHADLADYVRQGFFIPELHRALSPFTVKVPPLRAHPADVIPLANHFLKACAGNEAEPRRLAPDARGALRHYAWPGNVSELQQVVKTIAGSAGPGPIGRDALPAAVVNGLLAEGVDEHAPDRVDDARGRMLRTFLGSRKTDMLKKISRD